MWTFTCVEQFTLGLTYEQKTKQQGNRDSCTLGLVLYPAKQIHPLISTHHSTITPLQILLQTTRTTIHSTTNSQQPLGQIYTLPTMQYDFRLAVPRAGRALGWSSEIEGILFGSSSSDLEHLLLVPVQPVSSYTATTSSADTVTAAATSVAVTSAAVTGVATAVTTTAAANTTTMTTTSTGKSLVTFCSLPEDIHWLIFNHLNDPADLTCLGLAFPYLWDITQKTILRRYASQLGQWAGQQLVCIGLDHPDDFPPGLYSADELERINGNQSFTLDGVAVTRNDTVLANGMAITQLSINVYEPSVDDEIPKPLTLHNLCQLPNVCFENDATIDEKSRRVFAECIRRCQNPSQTSCIQEVRRKRGEIVTKSSPFIPRDQAWILRNLTTREFVTAAGIALDKKFIDGPFIKGIGFGEVVMSRVCWASYFRTDLAYSRYVNRGIWAGDRFDITTRGQHDESTKDEEGEWKDVSKEVAEGIALIWQYKYGNGWRTVARKIVAN